VAKGEGGTRAAAFKTLVDVLEAAAANIMGYQHWEKYSVPVYDRYKKTFSDVVVLDSVGPTDQSIPFFCDLANAPHMCAHVRERTFPHSNSHVNIDHYEVASAAAKAGLVNANACLDAVGQSFRSQGAGKLPRKCISKEAQDAMKSLSLDAERKFYPDRDGSDLLAQFDHALKEGKLCSVDTDALLAKSTWRDFFAGLSPSLC
jgi:hypothetical protein